MTNVMGTTTIHRTTIYRKTVHRTDSLSKRQFIRNDSSDLTAARHYYDVVSTL